MATIAVIAVIFVAGAVAGVIALVSWGIRREERDFTLTHRATGQVTQGTRRVTGLWVRQPADDAPWATREKLLV
jgi:hypothetical protein